MSRRKGNNFHNNRLSTVFTSGLTDVLEKYSPLKVSEPKKISTITFPDSRSSKESSRSVQEVSDSATPAKAPTEPYLIQENKYPSLRSLRTDNDVGDGLWICCHCHHENILRHWKGLFPFKYLRCDRCTRTLCSDCHRSEVLTPWPFGMVNATRPAPGREVRYCHACTNCGFTHRAEMEGTTLDFYGVTCFGCGATSYGDWPRYHIGNVEPYRRDPDSSFFKLVEARAEDAAKLVFRWEMAGTEEGADLCCKNLG